MNNTIVFSFSLLSFSSQKNHHDFFGAVFGAVFGAAIIKSLSINCYAVGLVSGFLSSRALIKFLMFSLYFFKGVSS